jgi:hypothetical protein
MAIIAPFCSIHNFVINGQRVFLRCPFFCALALRLAFHIFLLFTYIYVRTSRATQRQPPKNTCDDAAKKDITI